jgi:hypothetical protein
MLRTLQLLCVAATLLVHPLAAADTSLPAVASAGASGLIAPREYKWTFSFRGYHYGIEQYGAVASYPRNTSIIWRNRAHLIPLTVPGVIVIAGMAATLPIALLFSSGVRQQK